MIYTSGIITDNTRDESLEELQQNKLNLVTDKLHLKAGMSLCLSVVRILISR